MNEFFLHFVWQNQYFNKKDLKTIAQQSVEIKKLGHKNQLAGPDFKEAYTVIDGMHWFGSVEIHVKSSDWHRHKHSDDPNYENVILHVVYEYDQAILDSSGHEIPTLELKGLIKPGLKNRYTQLVSSSEFVPCSNSFRSVRSITRLSMLERVVVERLERKSKAIEQLADETLNDWEETAYQWLAQSLGFKTNAENMLALAKSIPVRILLKHQSLFQIEALLFVQGLLNIDFEDDYPNQLKSEYLFLNQKYGIKETLSYNQLHISCSRPTNIPTIRIAQLAALIHKNQNLFSLLTEFDDIKSLKDSFGFEVSAYCNSHYNFQTPSERKLGKFTKGNLDHLLINVSTLLLVALSKRNDNHDLLDKALNLLINLSKEENGIIRKWMDKGWNVSSAYDSQGLLELTNSYCLNRKCAQCAIGNELLTSSLGS